MRTSPGEPYIRVSCATRSLSSQSHLRYVAFDGGADGGASDAYPPFFHVSGGFSVRFFYNLLPTYCVTDAAPSGTFMKMTVSATCATHSVGWPLALSSLPLSGMIVFKECNVKNNVIEARELLDKHFYRNSSGVPPA